MTNEYFSNENGFFEFTEKAIKDWKSLFEKGGVDIYSIRTYEDYIQARHKCSDFFVEWLGDQFKGMPNTDDFNLLRSAIFDSVEEARKKASVIRRKRMKLI